MVGFGYAVPTSIRTNDDPIFDALRRSSSEETDFFAGTHERRCLAPGEPIEGLMVEASQRALADAGLKPGQIDRLYGYAFVSDFLSPNGLYKVHQGLGLDHRVMVVPVNAEFSNFITAVILAWEAIASGHARYVMVTCGASMSRYMDYESGHAASIGDGAASVILGKGRRFRLIDHEAETLSEVFDVMNMKTRFVDRAGGRCLPVDELGVPRPTYAMGGVGLHTVMTHGAQVPPAMVARMLGRRAILPADIAFVGHQPARSLMSHWKTAIQPGEYWDTYDLYGNITLASVPVTLAVHHQSMTSKYVVLVSPGTGTHFAGLLIER